MNARNLYVLIAREVSTDTADNMTSVYKIIEKFSSTLDKSELAGRGIKPGKTTLLVPANYSVATSWLFDKKSTKSSFIHLRLEVVDPRGKSLGGPEQEHMVPPDIDKVNLTFNTRGLPVTVAGKYQLRATLLSKNKETLATAEYPFEVELIWQEGATASQAG